jgi:hypothetical protein
MSGLLLVTRGVYAGIVLVISQIFIKFSISYSLL